jgi:hypothetical protein
MSLVDLSALAYRIANDTYRMNEDKDEVDLPCVTEAERDALIAALKIADGVLDLVRLSKQGG